MLRRPLQDHRKVEVGTDTIGKKATKTENVKARNMPGFSNGIGDVAVGCTVIFSSELRQIVGWFNMASGTVLEDPTLPKTLGSSVSGKIGAEIAHRSNTLDLDVLKHVIKPPSDSLMGESEIKTVELAELFAESIFVSLNRSLISDAKAILDSIKLNRLRHGGYLINTASGGLSTRTRSGMCGLPARHSTCPPRTPLPKASPLTDLNSTILGSHNAENITEAITEVSELPVDILI